MISSKSSKKVFIPIELSKLQDYGKIESLGFQHPNMLMLNDITESVIDDVHPGFLVVEDVDTIDWFFNVDVVNGLVYLYSLGMPSGGLRGHIYVSRDKHGRILPRMDKMKIYEDDIEDLVQIMMDVIYQPWFQLGAKR
ncbi:hypothetical protein OROGR_018929 [Orobanche gracilis]